MCSVQPQPGKDKPVHSWSRQLVSVGLLVRRGPLMPALTGYPASGILVRDNHQPTAVSAADLGDAKSRIVCSSFAKTERWVAQEGRLQAASSFSVPTGGAIKMRTKQPVSKVDIVRYQMDRPCRQNRQSPKPSERTRHSERKSGGRSAFAVSRFRRKTARNLGFFRQPKNRRERLGRNRLERAKGFEPSTPTLATKANPS